MRRLFIPLVAPALAALALAAEARAAGGSYRFDGGTPAEQRQVRAALDASSFNWSLVPVQITIHIARDIPSLPQTRLAFSPPFPISLPYLCLFSVPHIYASWKKAGIPKEGEFDSCLRSWTT